MSCVRLARKFKFFQSPGGLGHAPMGPGARGPGAECLRLLAEPVCFHHLPNFSIQWVKKQQLELDMERQTGSKLGKEFVKAVYCHPAYLTYMQSTS